MKECELCNSPARMYCESDQASLCWECDSKVHSANFLVARHSRSLLCHVCQSSTPWQASGSKLGPTVTVCERCVNRCNNRKQEEEERHGGNDDDDDDDDEEDEEDEDGDDQDDENDDDEGGDINNNDDDEDGDNQVVPWSSSSLSTPPPPVPSSSSSEDSSSRFSRNRGGGGGGGNGSKRTRKNVDLPSQVILSCLSSQQTRRVNSDDSGRPLKGRKRALTIPSPRNKKANLESQKSFPRSRCSRRCVDPNSTDLPREE